MAMFDRFAIFHKGGAVLWKKEASPQIPIISESNSRKGAASVFRVVTWVEGRPLGRAQGCASDSRATHLGMGGFGKSAGSRV